MKQIKCYFTLLAAILIFNSCKKDNNDITPRIDSMAGELPLLKGDNRIGTIRGFNPFNPPATVDSIAASWDDAIDAGMSVARLQIDWPELETSPNTYNQASFEQKLIELKSQGLQPFLLISAYDSEGPVIPADLIEKGFDDPELIQRFNNLMNWVIPLLVEYDGFLISISNEPDNSFEDVPGLEDKILAFLLKVKAHIHQLNQDMAVTVTLAEGSLDENKSGIFEILAACDVACWNFYGAKSQFEHPDPYYYLAQTESEIKSDIQRMLNVSGEKNIVIQELGMYSGNTTLNSSQEIQRKFFEVFFREMKNNERLKVAFNFQLVDWSTQVTQIFAQSLVDEGLPKDFIDQFSESLETIGLIAYSSGIRKKAWDEFLFWLTEFE
ncbi:MAG: hypothetical protein ACNS62_17235 [Candidatus Cyclobacteriaceae bacterium M3_2C_046]